MSLSIPFNPLPGQTPKGNTPVVPQLASPTTVPTTYSSGINQYVSPTTVPTTMPTVGGRGGVVDMEQQSAYFAAMSAIQDLSTGGAPRPKSYFQQWAEGGMSGRQMRSMYGKGWKDRMKIKTPKGKNANARARNGTKDKGNPWFNTPTSNGVSWRQ